jgi:hypothetical protein
MEWLRFRESEYHNKRHKKILSFYRQLMRAKSVSKKK